MRLRPDQILMSGHAIVRHVLRHHVDRIIRHSRDQLVRTPLTVGKQFVSICRYIKNKSIAWSGGEPRLLVRPRGGAKSLRPLRRQGTHWNREGSGYPVHVGSRGGGRLGRRGGISRRRI